MSKIIKMDTVKISRLKTEGARSEGLLEGVLESVLGSLPEKQFESPTRIPSKARNQ